MHDYVQDCLENPSLLPIRPPSFVEQKYSRLYAVDLQGKQSHDQYVYFHPNGLCIIGLAPSHPLFQRGLATAQHQAHHELQQEAQDGARNLLHDVCSEGAASMEASNPDGEHTQQDQHELAVLASSNADAPSALHVNFDVGNKSRLGVKASGKRKYQGTHFEENSILCEVVNGNARYAVRCCIKGKLLEVNERLATNPDLLLKRGNTEGYVAILAPHEVEAAKARERLLTAEDYMKLRNLTAGDLL